MIRSATVADAERLSEIYGYYVANTAISFEYVPPSPEEFERRIAATLQKYPYFVLEEEGKVWGYAYAGAFKTRPAYDRCCELSIYLDRNAKGKGYGRMLYEAMEEELKRRGFLNLYACVTVPIGEDKWGSRNSEEFHAHMGYTKVGEFHMCGYKFDHFYNMIWMEKFIGEHN